jgi:hypothetical protein
MKHTPTKLVDAASAANPSLRASENSNSSVFGGPDGVGAPGGGALGEGAGADVRGAGARGGSDIVQGNVPRRESEGGHSVLISLLSFP